MADKYLNLTVLTYFYNRLKTIFPSQTAFDALEDRVDDIVAEGGEPNIINTVKVNGTALIPDAQKAVDVTVPTATSDLTNDGDGTSNFATESYVQQNGGKIDKIKVNGTEQTITNKEVDITVPTLDVRSNPAGGSGTETTYTISQGDDSVSFNYTEQSGTLSDYLNVNLGSDLFQVPTINYVDTTFQTEAQVQALIDSELADITGIDFQVVQTLPASGVKGTIYLVPKTASTDDIYDEYIWLTPEGQTAHWELIGTTAVDLSNYWSKTELVAITTAEIDAMMAAA